jgi:uncharacterized protein (DUF697 family)
MSAIALLAAFADGEPSDAERARIASFVGPGKPISDEVYQRVIFKRTSIAQEAAGLDSEQLRREAFELAVGVCEADHSTTGAEKAFLLDLAGSLGIPGPEATDLIEKVDLLSDAPAAEPLPAALVAPAVAAAVAPSAPPSPDAARNAAVDSTIRTHAIICAALELLPQGLASAAIIPVQTKMVYSIGKQHGYELSTGHIKDFIGTIGVGVTSQVVESYARRLVGGMAQSVAGRFLGKSGAKMVGQWTGTGTGAAITFATTWALGQVARQYYAGGRKLSAIDLQSMFRTQVEQAKTAYQQHLPQIQQQASQINPSNILSMLRGK